LSVAQQVWKLDTVLFTDFRFVHLEIDFLSLLILPDHIVP
jgi:hypothetical protein